MLADFLKKSKLTQNLLKYQGEIWLILTVFLILALIIGLWQGLINKPNVEPLRIENVPNSNEDSNQETILKPSSPPAQSGTYVASKNGTKYYLPSCAGVKRIKEENKIYFNSVAEAEARGLTPAANCKGL